MPASSLAEVIILNDIRSLPTLKSPSNTLLSTYTLSGAVSKFYESTVICHLDIRWWIEKKRRQTDRFSIGNWEN